MTLVYPPALSFIFGAISKKRCKVASRPTKARTRRREESDPDLASEIIFSVKDFNSFAFARVVLIFFRINKFLARPLKRALRWSFFLPNFLPFFRCFISLRNTNFYEYTNR